MESTIRLCCSPLPKTPLFRLSNGSKGLANASSSRFHHTLFKFSHASLCASHFSTLHPIATRSLCPHANCFPDDKVFSLTSNNSEESNNNNVLRGVTGISLVLACALGLFNFNSKMNPMFSTAYAMGVDAMSFPGGEAAVESLLKTITAPSDQTHPKYEREDLGPTEPEVDALKLYAASTSKSGYQREAVKILKDEYEKYKKSPPAKDNLRMALIELLIFQGNFEEARKWLDQHTDELILRNKDVTDTKKSKIDNLLSIQRENYDNKKLAAQIAQLILYKAIVHSMLEKYKKEAPKWWEAFAKIYFAIKSESSIDESGFPDPTA